EKDGHIAWLILNRPEKRNTMNLEFFEGLTRHFQEFDEDPKVRVVIIRAEGKSFTAGMDLLAIGGLLQGDGADFREDLRKKIIELQESMNAIEKCRKPVIAAVHSHCIGGGVDLLSACDIRMATEKCRKPVIAAVHSHCIGGGVDLLSACDIRMATTDAIFSIRETRIAIIADLGTLQRLPHIIGHGWFRELADFTAEEALKMGFITRLYEDRDTLYEAAKKLADDIAACSPLTVQGVKDVILYTRDHGVYPGLEYVAQKNAALLQSEDLKEAFQAFMEKRPPEFKGK
ncbi:MAG: enoyl-CoA hydratase/isomerase family protein, partial [Deltaproteobacteria bacterium]|nr:enoyl-CoA hydratase/isomerase family protein [Deltaproteobacteria bacterium]